MSNDYKKDFDGWNEEKKDVHQRDRKVFFHEREVWWCQLGVNVGFEQDGTNDDYARPVVILKTFSTNAFLALPLTTRDKKGIYYFDLGEVDGEVAKAILSQIRFIDKKRLQNKVDIVDKVIFKKLKKAVIQLNLELED